MKRGSEYSPPLSYRNQSHPALTPGQPHHLWKALSPHIHKKREYLDRALIRVAVTTFLDNYPVAGELPHFGDAALPYPENYNTFVDANKVAALRAIHKSERDHFASSSPIKL